MLTVAVAAASGCRYNAAGNKADVESSSRGIFDNSTVHPRGNTQQIIINY